MPKYNITFNSGEKFEMFCIEGFTPQEAVRDWQNPSLPPSQIASIEPIAEEN